MGKFRLTSYDSIIVNVYDKWNDAYVDWIKYNNLNIWEEFINGQWEIKSKKKNSIDMKNYKLVCECKPGDWVFYDCGNFGQLRYDEEYDSWHHSDGYICHGCNKDSKVYPLTMHNKVIADVIQKRLDKMYDNGLINGSYWIGWLDDIYHKIMELDVDSNEYSKYWQLIDNKIEELIEAKKKSDDIRKQYHI